MNKSRPAASAAASRLAALRLRISPLAAGAIRTVLVSLILLTAGSSLAQEPAAEAEAAPSSSYPDRSELGPRYLQLVDQAAPARRRIAELARTADLEASFASVAERGAVLSRQADDLMELDQPSLDELLELRLAVSRYRETVNAVVDRTSGRIAELDQVRDRWQESRETWMGWRSFLQQRGELGDFGSDFERALRLIDEILGQAEAAVQQLADVQAPMRSLLEDSLNLMGRLDDELSAGRADLLRRDAPSIVAPAYLHNLQDPAPWRRMAAATASLSWPRREFFAGVAAVLTFQIILFVAAFFLARHFRRRFPDAEDRWRILLSHPIAIGIFVAAAFGAPLYDAPPAVWRLLLLTVLAGAVVVLTSGMFRNRRKRLVVYVLATYYVALTALETVALSGPANRLVITLGAALGLPFLLRLGRAEEAERGRRNGFAWMVYAGALVLGLVLAAQLLGFAALARWLLGSSLTTAFIAFTTVFMVRLGRGALRAALHQPREGRLLTLRRVGYELSRRLSRGLELVLIVVSLLYILWVWGLIESPQAGWRSLAAGGFELAGHEITLSQILFGVLAVYLAFVLSGVVRGLVGEELGKRPEVEPGLADSVSTLAHYALIIVGFFVALAILGFDLSSFAIVAGALGVGIGFGLQSMVNNFLSGLILLFERPVRVGDVVVIDGTWATIRKIGLRSTIVTTFEQSEIIVPNGDLVSEKVTNWTLLDPKTRIMIPVGVAYGTDLEEVFAILSSVADDDPRVADDPPPVVHFVDFADSALAFELRVWVAEISERLNLRSDLLCVIDRRFRDAGITIPFPQRDVHLHPPGDLPSGAAPAEAAGGGDR